MQPPAEFSDDPAPLLEMAEGELVREFPAGQVNLPDVCGALSVFSSGARLIGAPSRD